MSEFTLVIFIILFCLVGAYNIHFLRFIRYCREHEPEAWKIIHKSICPFEGSPRSQLTFLFLKNQNLQFQTTRGSDMYKTFCRIKAWLFPIVTLFIVATLFSIISK